MVLLSLLVVVATSWGFIELAAKVVAGNTQAFDEWAVRAVRQADDPAVPIGPRWLPEAGRDATALGSIAVLTFFTLVVAGYLWLDRKFWMMLYLLAATAGGLIVSLVLKQLRPATTRPSATIVRGANIEFSERALVPVDGSLPDAWFVAGCRHLQNRDQDLRPGCGRAAFGDCRTQSAVLGHALSDGYSRWLDGRTRLGAAVLDDRPLAATSPSPRDSRLRSA